MQFYSYPLDLIKGLSLLLFQKLWLIHASPVSSAHTVEAQSKIKPKIVLKPENT